MDIAKSVRYNSGINDPEVRFIIGTLGFSKVKDNIEKIFSCSEDKYQVNTEDTTTSNCPVFSHDSPNFYFIHTTPNKVAEYIYKMEISHASFESYAIGLKEMISPEGMFKHNENMPLIAEWGGGLKLRWNPEIGRKMHERKLQSSNIASCCLEKHLHLYLITAKSFDKEDRYGGELIYCELN